MPNKTKTEIIIPGDKSIFHRAVFLASLAQGKTIIKNAPDSLDCHSTLKCLKNLGVEYLFEGNTCIINGKTTKNFKKPENIFQAGNSGTTARLLSGILANLPFHSELQGDESLSKRPMERIISPLLKMGAKIEASENNTLPVKFLPSQLNGIEHTPTQASSQVKSSLLLAGLLAKGNMSLTEKLLTRDHLENLFHLTGINFEQKNLTITLKGGQTPLPFNIELPGDFSSAAYFIAIALISKNSKIKIKNIGLNKTRTGLLNVLNRMGANIKIENITYPIPNEPCGNIIVKSTELKGTDLRPEEVPSLIDELPLIAVIASQAKGITQISGAGELRFKESNRILAITTELKKMGANIEETTDGFKVIGKTELNGSSLQSYRDHRIAMSLSVADAIANGQSYIKGTDSVEISFPNFFEILKNL